MNLTDDELLGLVDEITLALGEILVMHRELSEGILGDLGAQQTQDHIMRKKEEIQKMQERLRKTKDAIRRKRELEKVRKDNAKETKPRTVSEGAEQIKDGKGRLVGYCLKNGTKFTYLNRKGELVAWEHGGKTFDSKGVYSGSGRQGLRLLGQASKGR